MVISEIFHSIQGEGITAGTPAIFVRLGMCNLQCNYCDTPYTWVPGKEDYSDEANERVVEAIALLLEQYPKTTLLIWTGGEPMLQQRDIVAAVDYLAERFHDRCCTHEVETNGTVAAQTQFDNRIHHYNCSPKTAMSGNASYSVRLKDFKKTTYKYVVGTAADCAEALKDIDRQKLPRNCCMFMVLGTTAEEMQEHGRIVAEVCKAEGIRMCIRLQSVLWGPMRGV